MIKRLRYGIEIADREQNGNLYFPPAATVLRGRWFQYAALKYDVGRDIRRMASDVGGDIPGLIVFVDLAKNVLGYMDPLKEDQKFAKTAEAVNRYMMTLPGNNKRGVSFTDKVIRTNPDANELKDWLHWMRQALDAGMAQPVEGFEAPPTLELIRKLPGARKMHGEPLQDDVSIEKHARYLYEVDENDLSGLAPLETQTSSSKPSKS